MLNQVALYFDLIRMKTIWKDYTFTCLADTFKGHFHGGDKAYVIGTLGSCIQTSDPSLLRRHPTPFRTTIAENVQELTGLATRSCHNDLIAMPPKRAIIDPSSAGSVSIKPTPKERGTANLFTRAVYSLSVSDLFQDASNVCVVASFATELSLRAGSASRKVSSVLASIASASLRELRDEENSRTARYRISATTEGPVCQQGLHFQLYDGQTRRIAKPEQKEP
jgi:hypothetical protein